MTCPNGSDRSFGPKVDSACRQFDFTLYFEDVVFRCIPASLLIPVSLVVMYQLNRHSRKTLRVWDRSLTIRLVNLLVLFGLQITFLVARMQTKALKTNASLAGDILCCASTIAVLALSVISHRRSIRPSTILSLYLSASILLGIPCVRTFWILENAVKEASIATAALLFTTIALFLGPANRTTIVASEKLANTPEIYSGLWDRTSFLWLSTTFRSGYAKVLSVSDLPELDHKLDSSVLHELLTSTWAGYNHHQRYSLLRATFRAYMPAFLSTIIPRLCLTAFTFAQPFLISTTVKYIGEHDATNHDYGKGLIGAWALAYLGIAVTSSIYSYQNLRFIMRIRGGLTALIYDHNLQTRRADMGDITAVSLMGTDVERIASGLQMFNETWSSLLDVAIGCWLLERQLSLACLAPVILILLFIAATSKVSANASSAQRKWIEKVQERLKTTSSMLSDIKAVKMLGISPVMHTIIQRLRTDEIRTSRVFRKILVITMLLSLSPINLAPVVTFAVYVIISMYWKNETLLTAQAFTSISLITLLTTPVITFIQSMPQVAQCIGSFDRIQEYCNYSSDPDGLDEPLSGSEVRLGDLDASVANSSLELQGSYAWDKTSPPVLKDVNISIPRDAITAVIGPVGSGKSALLNSLLGEMIASPLTSKSTNAPIRETVAYCAQESWLENKVIRENITGALPHDEKWYRTVKWACGLDLDISSFDKRDETRVGSQGLNVSGGQKQRISLARAVYSRARIVLLDDTFSGMDATTALRISSRLLGPGGLFRKNGCTVIVATHSDAIVQLADRVIALKDGRVIETGGVNDILCSGTSSDISTRELSAGDTAHQALDAPESSSLVGESAANLQDSNENDVRRKHGDLSIYKYYITSSGYGVFASTMLSMAVWIFCTEFSSIWVKWWSEANSLQPNKDVGMYLGVYSMLGVIGTLGATLAAWSAIISIISNSAEYLHSDLLHATLKAPLKFFSATDNGEILNRFSQDMELIDMDLPSNLINYTSTAMECLAKIVIIAVFSKYLGIALPFMGVTLYFLQRFYLYTSRQLRLLGIEAKAPLYSSFTETVTGARTIRAFGWRREYKERTFDMIGASLRPEYMLSCVQACLAFVLKILTTVLAVALVSISITLKESFSEGSVGVSLVMVVGFGETLVRLIQSWTRLESSIGAVSRVKRFVEDTESEDVGLTPISKPPNWPQSGSVNISNLTATYESGSAPVIRNISLSIQPGHHVAICGRSGGGKSSLLLSLLNMIDVTHGSISIDGIDICKMAKQDLRSSISVVTQEPFLTTGSLRQNIDPMSIASDDEITEALSRVRIWQTVRDHGGLDLALDHTSWSTGQKQLLCFARAIVKNCKILVLDECMSHVDSITEAVMQDIIDTEFEACTVISVMHRLTNVALYDRIALLDDGSLVEYDEPSKLLARPSRFAQLHKSHEATNDDGSHV